MAPTITPNADEGRKLASKSGEIVSVDTEALMALAAKYDQESRQLRASSLHTELRGKVTAARDAFDTTWKPQSVFKECADSGNKGTDGSDHRRIFGRMRQSAKELEALAGALVWIAQNTEEAQAAAAQTVEDIDTSQVGIPT